MTYNPAIPQAGDLISVSQADILTNFTQANIQFGNDHYEFDFAGSAAAPYNIAVAGDKGKHKQCTLIRVSADIANAGANEIGLYNKNAASGNQEIFYRRPSGGTVVQLTSGTPVLATRGSTFLPGGLMLKWGQDTANSRTNTTFTFPGVAFGAAPYSVTCTMHRSSNNVDTIYRSTDTPPTTTQFTVYNTSGSNRVFSWFAIGPS